MRSVRFGPSLARRSTATAVSVAALITFAQPLALLARPTRLAPLAPARAAAPAPAPRRDLPGAASTEKGAPNFDVRFSKPLDTDGNADKLGADPAADAARMDDVRRGVAQASAELAARVPGVHIETHDALGIAQIVDVPTSAHVLAKNEGTDRLTTVRTFLADNAGLYGLTREQVAKLEVVSDYTNPAGNLSFVELRQTIGGIPVLRGTIRAALTANGDLARTVAEVVPDVDYAATKAAAQPSVSAAEAVAAAAATIGVTVDPASLHVKSTSDNGRKVVFDRGPFDEDIQVEQQYFPLKPGDARLAWSMVLWRDVPAYYVFVDASSKTLLFRKNITNEQSQSATYGVYNTDSPAPASPSPALPGAGYQAPGISRTSLSVISELPAFDNLGWITDGGNTTTGNNVDCGLDIDGSNGIDSNGRPTGSPNRVFDFTYNPSPLGSDAPTGTAYRNGVVTDLFFWANRYHDRMYSYGFTEAAANFQNDNFGRGGLANDRVSAESQDSSGTNNANFGTPPDGSAPRCQMYIFTGPTPDRDGDLDAEIFIHEFTHGLSNRLHGNAAGLTGTQGGSMGEGWSDFYARCLLSTADENINGNYASGGYATNLFTVGAVTLADNYYYGIRRFPYALISSLGTNNKPFNPLTFADVDPSKIITTDGAFPESPIGWSSNGASEVHNAGEIWCSTLLEVRSRIIGQLGFATGNDRMLQITTDGMKLDPAGPTMLNARDSILAADRNGYAGASETQIWSGFAARGMGYGATVSPGGVVAPISVTESFATPNVGLGGVTFSDANCNNNGAADPGETITLTVPLTDQYAVTPATGVSATLVGGATQSYGTINGGQSVSRTFTYTVPAGTTCGAAIPLTFNITSSLGTVARTYMLQTGSIGTPLPASVYSSNGISVPIPASGTIGDMADQVINVADSGAVVDVNVKVRLNHTFDGDISLKLVSPNGTVVPLSTNRGASGDNYGSGATDCTGTFTVFDDAAATAISSGSAPYAGSFKPESPLSAINGSSVIGAWTLKINDNASGDSGTLYCWQLEITRAPYTCAPATCGGGNMAPVANAGPDAPADACTLVSLNGGGSNDPDSGPSPLTYAWTQTAGPVVTIAGANTSTPAFETPNVATSSVLTFQLTVSDGAAMSSDTVSVTVSHVAGLNVDTVGIVTGGNFFLRNCNASGPADVISSFGTASLIPIRGDWDGNGTDTEGAYDPANGNFFLRNSNTPGPADITFQLGAGGAIPVVGDWDGNGTVTVGIYVPASGTFFLKNTNTSGNAELAFAYGPPNATPLAGDWTGNGTTTVGIYVPATGAFFLRNSNTAGNADTVFIYGPGGAGVTPIVGNWDGVGGDTVGIYVSSTSAFFLKNTNAGGVADLAFIYGAPGSSIPLGGNWDGF